MAENSKDELNNKREQSKVEQQINEVLNAREQAYRRSVKTSGDALDLSRQITEDIKDQLGMTRAKAEADTGALSLARKLQQSAQQVTSELGNQGKIQRQLINDNSLLSSIRTEISIIDRSIGESNAQAAADIAKSLTAQQTLQKKIEEVKNEMAFLDDVELEKAQTRLKDLNSYIDRYDRLIKTKEDELKKNENYTAGDVRRLIQLKQQEELAEKIVSQREDELDIQRRIEDRTGVTGALVEGVGGIMQRLGMRSGIFQNAMEKAAEEMQKMAEESERVDENGVAIGRQYSKTAIALKGLSELSKGFGKALGDPLTITLAIADAFFKVDAAASKLQQTTGQNSTIAAGLNTSLASTVDVLEVMTELTAQTGMNAQNIFSPDVLAGAAELKNTMGLTAEAAGGLAKIAQTTVGSIHGVTDSVVGTVSAFNKANRSAVSQGVVLNDVANAADDIKASFAGNPELLAEAASAARKIGLELSRVDQIASSLMDFESSIEAELEAQLLTGKSINMAKARELALNNDIAGLTQELFKNSADIADFGKMNRIQQEAQAKALGVSREELGRMAYQAALNTGLTEEQAAAAANVKAEDMQRMAVQEKLAKAAEKMTQAFAPMLDILIPVADLIGFIAKIITYPVSKLMELADSVRSMNEDAPKLMGFLADGLKLLAGIGVLASLNAFKNLLSGKGIKFDLFSKLKDKITGAKDKISGVTDKVKENTEKIQDKTSKTDKPGGKGSNGLKGLAKGLKKMGEKGVIQGIGNLALSVVPLTLMVAAVPALMGLAAFGIAAGAGLKGLGKGLQKFGEAMKALGPTGLGYAALGLGLLTAALIGIGFALKLAAPAFEAIGLAIKSAFEGIGSIITAAAEGIASILREVTLEKAVALVAVGGAFAALGLGLASLGASLIFGVAGIGVLAGIAAMADPLSTVGTSLTAIAAGLAAMQVALDKLDTEKLDEIKSLVTTTAFAAPAIAATGAITSLINGITGGDDSSNASLEAKLDELISVVKQGGNINMDGNKVGQYIMLSANKSA